MTWTARRALPPDWPKRRQAAYRAAPRDEFGRVLCGLCDSPITGTFEVDHIDRDDDRIEMLRPVHPQCHKQRTADQAAASRVRPARVDEAHPRTRMRDAFRRTADG